MSAAATMDNQQQPPHSLAMLHTSPTGQPFIGHPPAPSPASDPNRAARVPLDKVQTGEGVTQNIQDKRTLWLECQSAGFKVECEIKPEDEEQQTDKKELVLRDSSKNVQSVVVEVDQSPETPSALVVLTLAPSAGASSPRYYHFHLALSHPSYSHLDVEKLKHILRGWQQSSNGTLKAVIAPQLALSPTDPRPPAKPEDYNPSDSTTWVAPFPVQVPPAPPAPATPAAAPNSSGLTSLADLDADADGDVDAPGEADIDVDAPPTGEGSSSGKKRRSSLSQAGSPEAHEDAILRQNAASDDPLFWNDTGRARRRSTLKVKSYVEGGGEAPMNLDGTGERARTSKSPPKNPSAPSYPYPSAAAPALSSNKRTLDADVTAAKKRRRSPSASAASPRSSASAALPNVGGHFTRGASAAAQQQQQLQQQQQQQQVDLALVGNLPPLPEGLAAHVANAPGGVARPIAPRPGPSTPSSSVAFATGGGPSSALGHPTSPAYSPYTPAASIPGSAPAGGVAPTPLSVYSQLHDLYAYVAQLAPMVTESKGTIKRLEMEGVEREREVRRLREEVLLLRQTGSPRGSQASLGDVGEVVSTGEGQVEAVSAASSATLSAVGGAGAGGGKGEGEKAVVEPAKAVEAEEAPAVQEGEKAVADAEKVVEAEKKDEELPVSEADAAVPEGL